ncbi:unnamed protein product, partial [Ectocarpus sp. 13 AM-2016]
HVDPQATGFWYCSQPTSLSWNSWRLVLPTSEVHFIDPSWSLSSVRLAGSLLERRRRRSERVLFPAVARGWLLPLLLLALPQPPQQSREGEGLRGGDEAAESAAAAAAAASAAGSMARCRCSLRASSC